MFVFTSNFMLNYPYIFVRKKYFVRKYQWIYSLIYQQLTSYYVRIINVDTANSLTSVQ